MTWRGPVRITQPCDTLAVQNQNVRLAVAIDIGNCRVSQSRLVRWLPRGRGNLNSALEASNAQGQQETHRPHEIP